MRMLRRKTPAAAPLPPGASRVAVDALLDVAAIEDNLVRRRDGQYAALIEVQGEAFSLLTPDEQDLRIEAWGRVLTGLSGWFQVTRLVEPTDLTSLRDQWTGVATRLGPDAPLGQLAHDYATLTERLERQLLSHVTLVTVWAKSADACRERARMLLQSLSDQGFAATWCDAERLAVILQIAYGHVPVAPDSVLRGLPAAIRARAAAAPGRGDLQGGPPLLAPHMPTLRDLVEPAAVVEVPGYLDLGGHYSTTLVTRTWPEQVFNEWLEWLYTFDEPGVRRRVSFYCQALASSEVMADLRRRQVQLDAETRWARKRGLREDFEVELGEEAIEFLRQEIGRGRQKMFLVTLFVTLIADHPDQLHAAVRHLQQQAAGALVTLRPLYLEASLGFRATIPIGVQPVPRAPDRGIPTIALATAFPFSAGELLDPRGDLWGENLSTGNLVVIDPQRFQARHMLVVAKTRAGKSATLKVLATQALMRSDEQVLIIDPSPPIDYERWTRWLGGAYLVFGPGSPVGLNPLDIVLPATWDRIDDSMRAPIRAKIAFATELLGLMGRQPLTPEEEAAVSDVLTQVFTAHGLTPSAPGSGVNEWETVRDPASRRLVPEAKPAPTLRAVWDALLAHPETQAVGRRIQPFITGVFTMFSGPTTVDLSQPLVVFNVYGLIQGAAGRQHQAVAYAMIFEHIRWRLAQSLARTFIIVDEGHVMFEREDTARFVSQLFRMAAKQGGRVGLITQGIVDIMGDPATGLRVAGQEHARYCLENSGFKFLMRNDNDADIDLMVRTLGITPAEGRAIKAAKRGQGILLIGDPQTGTQRAWVQTLIPDRLYPWITSNPEEVERFRAQGVYGALEQPAPPMAAAESSRNAAVPGASASEGLFSPVGGL